MPDAESLSLHTAHTVRFALPCMVKRAVSYLSDPHILLAAVPGIQRAVLRRQGTYRLTLTPVHAFGLRMHPVAEVAIIAHANAVRIASTPLVSQDPGQDEIAMALNATLDCAGAATGCTVRATLSVDTQLPSHMFLPLMPRAFVLRSVETLLAHRLRGEVDTMARLLPLGYPEWDGPCPAMPVGE